MAKEVHRQLRDEREKQFNDNPSTVSTSGGDSYSSGKENFKVNNGLSQGPSNNTYSGPDIDMTALAKSSEGFGPSSDSGIGIGQMGNSHVTNNKGDAYDTKIMGINIGRPSASDMIYNPYTGINDQQEAFDQQTWKSTSQSNWSKSVNVGTQFIGKTFINTAGGIIGGFYSLGAASAQGIKNAFSDDENKPNALNLLSDNSVNRFFDKGTEWMDENNTINTHKTGEALNDFFSFNTIKGVGDAYSFIAGAVLSEVVVNSLSGGAGLAGAGARVANGIARLNKASTSAKAGNFYRQLRAIEKLTPEANKLATIKDKSSKAYQAAFKAKEEIEMISKSIGLDTKTLASALSFNNKANAVANFARTTVTGTFWEAGLEARQAKDSLKESMMSRYMYDLERKPGLTDEQRTQMLEEYEKQAEIASNSAGNLTFGLNVGLLKISNAVQFPSLFGNRYGKRLKRVGDEIGSPRVANGSIRSNGIVRDADGLLSREATNTITNNGTWFNRKNLFNSIANIPKKSSIKLTANVLKNPLVEAYEEYSQYLAGASSTNFYSSLLDSNYGIDPDVSKSAMSYADALLLAFKESGKNDAWDEAIIGGIVGALGIPMMKKSKNGKRQFVVEGGIAGSVREYRQANLDKENTINLYDSTKWNEALRESIDRSVKRANAVSQLSDVRDSSAENGNRADLIESQNDLLMNNIIDKAIDGNIDFLEADLNDIANIDFNDQAQLDSFLETYINPKDLEGKSAEEIKAYAEQSRNDVLDYAKVTINAYNSVAGGISDTLKGVTIFDQNIIKMLTHATAKLELNNKKIKEIISELTTKTNGLITEQEAVSYATNYRAVSNAIDNILKVDEIGDTSSKALDRLNEETEKLAKRIANKEVDSTTSPELQRQVRRFKTIIDNLNKEISEGRKGKENRRDKAVKSLTNHLSKLVEEMKKMDEMQGTEVYRLNEEAKKSLETVKSKAKEFLKVFSQASRNLQSSKGNLNPDRFSPESELSAVSLIEYLESAQNINNLIEGTKIDLKSAEAFKELLNEETLEDNINHLIKLQEDLLVSQKVAGYFYNNMDNQAGIANTIYGDQIGAYLRNIAEELFITEMLSQDSSIPVEDIKKQISNIAVEFEKLEDLIDEVESKGVPIKDNASFMLAMDDLKSKLNSLATNLNVNVNNKKEPAIKPTEENTNTSTETEESNEDSSDENSNGEGVAPGSSKGGGTANPSKSSKEEVNKVKNNGFNTKPNRLYWDLNMTDGISATRQRLRDLIDKGLLKSESGIIFQKTDDSHETDEWFKETGIDKEKFNRGKKALAENMLLIDSAFNPANNKVKESNVFDGKLSINSKVLDVNSGEFKNNLATFKSSKETKSTPAPQTKGLMSMDTLVSLINNKIEILNEEIDEAERKSNADPSNTTLLAELNTLQDRLSAVNLALMSDYTVLELANQGPVMGLFAKDNHIIRPLINAYHGIGMDGLPISESNKEESVAEAQKVFDVSEEYKDMANNILANYPDLSSLITPNELGEYLETNKVRYNSFKPSSESSDSESSVMEDVRYYVSNFRLELNVQPDNYSEVNLDNPKEGYKMFLPSVDDIISDSYLKDLNDKVDIRLKAIDEQTKLLNQAEAEKDGPRVKEISKVIKDLKAEIEVIKEHRNDRSNVAFRKRALKEGTFLNKLNTINLGQIAQSDFTDRNPDGSFISDGKRLAKEFNVIGDKDSTLAGDVDNFLSRVVYRTKAKVNSKEPLFKNVYGDNMNFPRTIDSKEPMTISTSASTGDYFYIHTDKTGRNVAIKLNNGMVNEALAKEIKGLLNKFMEGNATSEETRKIIRTYAVVLDNEKSEPGSIPNSIYLGYKKEGDNITNKEITLSDKDGNLFVLNESNFMDPELVKAFVDGLVNTRSNVMLGHIKNSEGILNKSKIKDLLDQGMLNIGFDVSEKYDKVYDYDSNDNFEAGMSITTEDFKVSSQPSKGPLSNNQSIHNIKEHYKISGTMDSKNLSIKVAERAITNMSNAFAKLKDEYISDESIDVKDREEFKAFVDDISNGKEISKESMSKNMKVVKKLLIQAKDRLVNTSNEGFITNVYGNSFAYMLSQGERNLELYTEGKPDNKRHIFNKIMTDMEKVMDKVINGNQRQLGQLIAFKENKDKFDKQLETLNRRFDNGERRVIEINKKEGSLFKIDKDAVNELKVYFDMISELDKFNQADKDKVVPIAKVYTGQDGITSTNINNNTTGRIKTLGAISEITTSKGEKAISIVFYGSKENPAQVEYNKKRVEEGKKPVSRFKFTETIRLGEREAKGASNYVIADISLEEMKEIRNMGIKYMTFRNELNTSLNAVSPESYKSILENIQKRREVIEKVSSANVSLNPVEVSSDMSSYMTDLYIAFEKVGVSVSRKSDSTFTINKFVDNIMKDLYGKNISSMNILRGKTSEELKKTNVNHIAAYLALFNDILTKQGLKAFGDKITIPNLTIKDDFTTISFKSNDGYSRLETESFNNFEIDSKGKELTEKEFFESKDPTVVAVRLLYNIFVGEKLSMQEPATPLEIRNASRQVFLDFNKNNKKNVEDENGLGENGNTDNVESLTLKGLMDNYSDESARKLIETNYIKKKEGDNSNSIEDSDRLSYVRFLEDLISNDSSNEKRVKKLKKKIEHFSNVSNGKAKDAKQREAAKNAFNGLFDTRTKLVNNMLKDLNC